MRDLVERESGCCSFFTFTTAVGEEVIPLDIVVDQAHEPVLDALAARTAAPGERPRFWSVAMVGILAGGSLFLP
ncbi:hypothetical protein [Streptomyces sp. NBC_01343]|uniref:hypothetical protein n=1 Tax=Streptomyces sp. NBC_01343 TaxID=2903832 RepID=UPI002E0FDBB6